MTAVIMTGRDALFKTSMGWTIAKRPYSVDNIVPLTFQLRPGSVFWSCRQQAKGKVVSHRFLRQVWGMIIVAILCGPLIAEAALAANRPTFIRDTEIESIIKSLAVPLFKTANLDPDAIRVHVIMDPRLNAFVAGGRNIFINTGLLVVATPEELVAVLAHETAHIAGGHLVRTQEAMRNAAAEQILACMLAGVAVAASRESQLAAPAMQGCSDYGLRTILRYTQTQESSADQAGLALLAKQGWPRQGMVSFLGKMAASDTRMGPDRDPYLSTHPLSRDRIIAVETRIKDMRKAEGTLPSRLRHSHALMLAKLQGYLGAPYDTRQRYPTSDQSVAARYARAIALYRESNVDEAVKAVDALIHQQPNNPYFHELKGQMLLEAGRLTPALPAYRRAVKLSPRAYLIRASLAQVLTGLGGRKNLEEAVTHLTVAVHHNPQFLPAWHLLGIAHGQAGNTALSSAAFAEEAYLRGDKEMAVTHIKRAEKGLKVGSRAWLRLEDLKRSVSRMR